MTGPSFAARRWTVRLAAGAMALLAAAALRGSSAAPSPHPMSLPEKSLISRTILSGDVTGDPGRESVVLAEYLTGRKGETNAVGVLLGVYRGEARTAVPVWTRDYAEVLEGAIFGAQLALIDLDLDGRDEIYVEMHHDEAPESIRVVAEILRDAGGKPFVAWSGPVRVDTATKSSRLPAAQRERYRREIDLARSARTRGGMVVFRKTVLVAGGVAIDPPRVLEESFPLQTAPPAR